MRITNQMSANRMLMNINRNARTVDNYYMQLGSGKKVQRPSDNPIIASRALKFRTTVSDTAQYARNADQAKSWMDMTDEASKNTLDIMEEIRELLVQGATDTLTPDDKEILMGKIRTAIDQIGGEMNMQYAGRYVFSGFRTDEPPIITEDDSEYFYDITQQFYASDIQKTAAYYRDEGVFSPVPEVTVYDIFKIDLPYKLDDNGISNLATTMGGNLTVKYLSDVTCYNVGANDINFLPETGELILGENIVNQMNNNPDAPYNVSYRITDLKEGDLNPVVYFDCTEWQTATAPSADPTPIYNVNPVILNQIRSGVSIRVFSGNGAANYVEFPIKEITDDSQIPSKPAFDSDTNVYFNSTTNQIVLGGAIPDPFAGNHMDFWREGDPVSMFPNGQCLDLNLINPTDAYLPERVVVNDPKYYNMDDQALRFEFGANTRVQINNLAKDSYTAVLHAELSNLYDLVSSAEMTSEAKLTSYYSSAAYTYIDPITGAAMNGSMLTEEDVKKLVDDHIAEEVKKAEDYTQKSFSSALGRHDNHTSVILKEYTTLGSRMNRVDMTINRLEQNTVSYTQLMSENENIDYYEVIMNLSSMEAVYSASMMAGSRISQMSLANYIN